MEKSQLPILIINQIESSAVAKAKKMAKTLSVAGRLIFNFDDERTKELKEETNFKKTTFGFQEGADFQATDINLSAETNFKINHKGNSVPFWMAKVSNKEQVYPALIAIATGIILDLNLIEASNSLKSYQPSVI